MIMNYPLKNREGNNKYRFIKIALYIIFVLIVVSVVFPNITKGLAKRFAVPLFVFKNNTLTDENTESFFHTKAGLISLNKELKEENAKLLAQSATFIKLEDENAKIREILGSLPPKEMVFAEVLSSPPVSLYDTLVISKNNPAIVLGAEVYSYENVPIGTISDVFSNNALVRLYSSAGNSFQVVFDNNTEVVEISGMGGGAFRVKIPKSIKVLEGSSVYFRGTTKLLGVVKKIEESPSDSFKEVFIQSPINIFQIESVLVSI